MNLSEDKKLHWRKTAKICPKCNQLRSHKQFIVGIENCARCAFDEMVEKDYSRCCYCKGWQKKDEFPKRRHKKDKEKESSICRQCLQIFRERHAIFKGSPTLEKGRHYVCNGCGISKSHFSFPRASNPETDLICKCCVTNRRIKENGEFRCKGCASVFPVEQIHWNKYCARCYEKNKEWNKYKLRELRKDPVWAEYFKEMQRCNYYNVFKPIYNKVLALQIAHGLAKKRKINRNGFFYILNHQLFDNFRRNFKYWDALTSKVINAMKNRGADYKMEEIARRNGQGYSKKESRELDVPHVEDWG